MMEERHRYLEIIFHDGNAFVVRMAFIAGHRAGYYANADQVYGKPYQETYQHELDYAMSQRDGEEAIDWLKDAFNWPDIAPFALCITPTLRQRGSYEEEWPNPEVIRTISLTDTEVLHMDGVDRDSLTKYVNLTHLGLAD